jgi:hypothetical protein
MHAHLSHLIDWFVFGGDRFERSRDGAESRAAVAHSLDLGTYDKGTNFFGS